DGMVYLQVTRGVSPRDHAFPGKPVRPALVMTAKRLDFARIAATAAQGVGVVTQPDIRWGRCDIKTVSLLANVLAKQTARAAGAFECWMVDRDGLITEGSSSNAWIVDATGRLRTRSLSQAILPGITRQVLFAEAGRAGIEIAEQPFTVEEVLAAREAFTTSTTAFVMPVVRLDGKAVGDGRPGELTMRLRRIYDAHMSPAD
ncbi:MAG: aminotransferase class IV, partial [Ferrovibrionaceae bacterium]